MGEGARYFENADKEIAQQRKVDVSRARAAAASEAVGVDPVYANRVSDLRKQYPWMTAGAALSLAKGGIPPEAPPAVAVAKAAAKRKVKKGFGWHSIGDGVGKGAGAVGGVAADVAAPVGRVAASAIDEVGDAVKPVVRGTLVGLQTGAEAVDFTARQLSKSLKLGLPGGGATGAGARAPVKGDITKETTLGQALVHGESLGRGYFTQESPAGKAQAEAARASLSIDGHAGTLGRILAHEIYEPGTKPYQLLSGLVDAGVDIYADPASIGLSKLSQARKASKLLVDDTAGLVGKANRLDVDVTKADKWLAGDGRKVVKKLAEDDDFYSIWKRYKGKIDAPLAAKLADARSEDEVLGILRPELGITIREKLHNGLDIGVAVRRRLDDVRLLGVMPGDHLDPNNIDDAVKQLDRFMLNAKMSPELRAKQLGDLARAPGPNTVFRVAKETTKALANDLAGKGIESESITKMTRMFGDYHESLAKYAVDAHGNNMQVLGATIDGVERTLPTPHLYTEYLHRTVPLPDARELRRATSDIRRIVKALPGGDTTMKAADLGTATLDLLGNKVWKPLVLLRGAWTVRVIGEEQVRMAGSGLTSMVNHPISALAWAIGRDSTSKVAKLAEAAHIKTGRGGIDALGQEFGATEDVINGLSDFARSQSRRGGGWIEHRNKIQQAGKTVIYRGHEDFAPAHAEELIQLATDPIARRVAGGWGDDLVPGGLTGNHVDDAKRWFWDGPGKIFRKEMADAPGREALAIDRQVADDYIESVFDRIQIKTGGDSTLLDAVATGTFDGQKLRPVESVTPDSIFVKHLKDMADQGKGPEAVKADLMLSAKRKPHDAVFDAANSAVEHLFNFLMSRPTNFLSRSPAFRQYYWQRIDELMPSLTSEAQQQVLKAAAEAKLPKKAIESLTKRTGKAGELALDDADNVAKGFGLDQTRKLLYDLTERSQLFDVTRIIFPFGEAWKEVLTRWAKIGMENPKVIRRGQVIINGARGSGFFHKDPATGEEMWTMPGSEFITEKAIGIPVPFEGKVAGLNMFSSNPFMPGVGPIVQLAAAKVIPDKPDWDWARKIILPMGEPDLEKNGIIETYLPAWFQKARQGFGEPADERLFLNTVHDLMRYLVSTGEYSTSSPEEMRQLEDAARRKAKSLYVIRSAAQFFSPSAPTPKFLAMDKNGDAQLASKLIEDFYNMQNDEKAGGYETAPARFLERYGDQAFLFMQAKSEGGGPVTDKALDWVRNNPKQVRAFPDTYRYFGPQDGEFDFTAYQRGFDTGERKSISPEDALKRANDRLARMIYKAQKEKVGPKPNAEQSAWLRKVKEELLVKYPGFEPKPLDMGKRDRIIRELELAVKDPKLKKTDAGKALNLYLGYRQQAFDVAQSAGLATFAKGKKARSTRTWLRGVAAKIIERHPEFAEMYEQVLEREMVDDAAKEES